MIAWIWSTARRTVALFRRSSLESRLEEELRLHLEMLAEEKQNTGMNPKDAGCAALRSFGGVDQTKEACRDGRSWRYLEDFIQDLRFGIRMFCRKPGFAIASVLILALAIGPNTAFFSVIRGVLFNDMPYPESGRLIQIYGTSTRSGDPGMFGISYPDFLDYVKYNRSLENVALARTIPIDLTGRDEPERVQAIQVSSSLFTVLQRTPLHGRVFSASEDKLQADPVVILSYGLWQRKFSGKTDILGNTISVDRVAHTIVGIMPADFKFTERRYDLLLPLAINPAKAPRDYRSYFSIARLKPGASMEQVRGDLSNIAAELAREFPNTNSRIGVLTMKLGRNYLSRDLQVMMQFIFLAVLFVLLIACANISTLLLARAIGRKKEIAVRASLGGSRTRILRQLLTEGLLLALMGGSLGAIMSYGWLKFCLTLAPVGMPNQDTMSIDAPALIYTAVLALLSSMIFGIIPALRNTGSRAIEALKEEGRATAGRARHRLLNAFLVAEAAMALMLLIFSGLMTRSFRNQMSVDLGFDRKNLLVVQLILPESKYGKPAQLNFFTDDILTQLSNQKGIQLTAASTKLPMDDSYWSFQFSIQGRPPVAPDRLPIASSTIVTRDYFHALHIPLNVGRYFSDSDRNGPPVAIINETLAKRYLPDCPNPVEQRIKFDLADNSKWKPMEIVGVVGDTRDWSMAMPPQPQIYLPFSQHPQQYVSLIARTERDPLQYAAVIRNIIKSIDAEQPILSIRSMEQMIEERVDSLHAVSQMMSILSVFALALAALGIYSVVSYAVSEKTKEIGIRMAFGAQRNDICRMILWRGLMVLGTGLFIGMAGALVSMPLLHEWLFGVTSRDLLSYIVSGIVLISAGIIAMFVPVRRAILVDPMSAIRYE